jgi:uncharacterized membrane protein HdeD (DUF308 family)
MSQAETVRPTEPAVPDLWAETAKELRRHWLWELLLGILLVVLGMVALGHVLLASVFSALMFGWLLVIAGVGQVIEAIRTARWGGSLWHLLEAVLCLLVGGLVLAKPGRALEILTLMAGIFLTVEGVFRMVVAIVWRLPHGVWMFLSGLISLVLGLMIWSEWPSSSVWVLGTFLGIDLLFNGWSLIMLAIAARSYLAQGPPPPAAQP